MARSFRASPRGECLCHDDPMTETAPVNVIVRFAPDVAGPARDELVTALATLPGTARAGWDLGHRGPDDGGQRARALLTLTADVTEIASHAASELGLAVSRFLRSVSGPRDGGFADITDPSQRVWRLAATDSPAACGLIGDGYGPGQAPAGPAGEGAPLTWHGTRWSAAPGETRPSPVVFVSYAHDTPQHKADVRRLCELLAADRVTPVLDQFCLTERQDWYRWAIREITSADYVLVIASERCRVVGDGRNEPGENRGLASEMGLLRDLCCSDDERWTRRILPVVLPGHSPAEIPLFLQPWTKDHYIVPNLTADGLAGLLALLHRGPASAAGPTAT